MLIALLYVLLYAVVACLVLELIFWILAMFLTIPGKVRQLCYAIVGVLILIYIVQVLAGSGQFHLPGKP